TQLPPRDLLVLGLSSRFPVPGPTYSAASTARREVGSRAPKLVDAFLIALHAGGVVWAVTIWNLVQVLLVLVFGEVVLTGISIAEEFDLSSDSTETIIGELFGVAINQLLNELQLFLSAWIKRGAILRAHVIALPKALGRIVCFQRHNDQVAQANLFWVVGNFYYLSVVGLTTADFKIGGIWGCATGITDRGGFHAIGFPVHFLMSPETAQPDNERALAFLPGPSNWGAQNCVRLRIQNRF